MAPYDVLAELFPNLNYIWIMRRDKVRQAVSFWKGLQTLVWWQRIGDPEPELKKAPEYNFEAIDYLVQEIVFHEASWQAYFTRYNITPFTIIYEDFAVHYEQTALNILDWLNIPYLESLEFAPRQLQKQADGLSEKWIHQFRADKQEKECAMESNSPFQISTWNYNTTNIS